MTSRLFALISLGPVLCACGSMARPSEVPVTPVVEVQRATVSGRVTDPSGIAIADASVIVAETDDATVTDADGRYTLSIPADSTVTLRALKPIVYTSTTVQAFVAPAGANIENFDVLLLAGSTLGAFNQMVNPSEDRGVVAVNFVSLSGRCSSAGATVGVGPIPAGKTFYVRDGDHRPDATLMGMQLQGTPQAWVVSVPPTTGYSIEVTQANCQSLTFPVTWKGVAWQQPLRITKGLTQAWAFVE